MSAHGTTTATARPMPRQRPNSRRCPASRWWKKKTWRETTAVQKTMTGMILQDGAALLIPSSFGYFDPHILALAPKYQKVRFAPCGGLWTQGIHPANVGSFFGYITA